MRLYSFVLALASVTGLAAQAVEDGIPDNMCCCPEVMTDTQPHTAGRLLQCAGYESTSDSLIAALADRRAYVRSLAAGELAKWGKGVIPAVISALATEAAPGTRIWMANTLAQLGEARGVAALADMCNRYSDPDHLLHQAWLRAMAAGETFRLGNESCRDEFVATLRFLSGLRAPGPFPPAYPPAAVASQLNYALSIAWVANAGRLLEPKAPEIREIVERSLGDDDSAVRMTASNIVSIFGDASSIQKLRKALAVEPDYLVHARMAFNLKEMEGRQDRSGQDKK